MLCTSCLGLNLPNQLLPRWSIVEVVVIFTISLSSIGVRITALILQMWMQLKASIDGVVCTAAIGTLHVAIIILLLATFPLIMTVFSTVVAVLGPWLVVLLVWIEICYM